MGIKGLIPPFYDELIAVIIQWFITSSCHHFCEMKQQNNVPIMIKCFNRARYLHEHKGLALLIEFYDVERLQ